MEYHNKRQTKEWQEMHKPGQVVVLLGYLVFGMAIANPNFTG
jgi:predicted phosphohydrolase